MINGNDPNNNDGLSEGEHRKGEAFEKFEQHRERLLIQGRRALLTHALTHGVATADDVRDVVEVPAGINPKCLGPVPSPLAKANIIRAKRQIKTRRPIGHARFITEWELINPTAAVQWMQSNPEPPAAGEAVTV
jgi:hypothetical protein